jgi:hypothetical protein
VASSVSQVSELAAVGQGSQPSQPASLPPTPNTAASTAAPDLARWGITPSPAADGSERDSFQLEINPGSSAVDFVAITNLSSEDLVFDLYAADGVITDDGQPAILDRSSPAEDLAAWIGFNSPTATVAAGQRLGLPFRVSVPSTATPGDHCGGLIASLNQQNPPSTSNGLTVDARTAAWICVTVPGEVVSSLAVSQFKVTYTPGSAGFSGGQVTVSAQIANNGNLRQSGIAQLALDSPFGLWQTRLDGIDIPELLPGQSYLLQQTVDDVPPAIQAEANLQVSPQARPGHRNGSTIEVASRIWLAPWVAGLLLGLVLVFAWYLLTARRRRRRLIDRAVAQRLSQIAAQSAAPE